MYDGVPVLKRLKLDHVQHRGYVALRCSWTMGCPAELHPLKPKSNAKDDREQNEAAYATAFRHLFPGEQVPEVVDAFNVSMTTGDVSKGASCTTCAFSDGTDSEFPGIFELALTKPHRFLQLLDCQLVLQGPQRQLQACQAVGCCVSILLLNLPKAM